MMRVMHLVHSMTTGGIERILVSTANGLSQRGCPQSICCLHEGVDLLADLLPEVKTYCLNARANDALLPLKIHRAMRSFQPDVVDSVDYCSWPDGTLAGLLMPGVRRIHTFHGFLDRPPLRHRLVGTALAKVTHRVRAVAHDLADRVAAIYRIPRQQISVTQNGVDVDYFRRDRLADAQPAPIRGAATFNCVTVASLSTAKNPLLLIDIAKKTGQDIHFTWVGDGPLRPQLEGAIRENHLEHRINLVGNVDDPWPHLAKSNAFVLPSRTEAFPVSVIEAMAMKLPIIAAKVGDLDRIVGPNLAGLLVGAGEVDQFSEAIQTLRSNPSLCRAMGEVGRHRAVKDYSRKRMLDRYQALYGDTVVRRRGQRQVGPVVASPRNMSTE